jgi:integrase
MPRLVNQQPKYALHKASGQAVVCYRGKVKYLGKYDSPESRLAYQTFLDKLPKPDEVVTEKREIKATEDITISQLVLAFYRHSKQHYIDPDGKLTGQHHVIRAALRPLRRAFPDLPCSHFGPKKFKRLQEIMAKRPSWCRGTVNRATSIIKQAFRWGASEELFHVNVSHRLDTVDSIRVGQHGSRETKAVEPVADEIVARTLPHISPMPADMVRLMRLTGARPIELRRLTAAQIDRADPELWQYRPQRHKTAHKGKKRVILFDARCQAILKPYLFKAGENGIAFPIAKGILRQAVQRGCARAFPHPVVGQIPPSKRTKEDLATLEQWNKEHAWHPYRLRHSAATETRELFDLESVQGLCGHATQKMSERYAGVDVSKAAKAVRAIGRKVVS